MIKYYICGRYLMNGKCYYKVNHVIKKGFFVKFHAKKWESQHGWRVRFGVLTKNKSKISSILKLHLLIVIF